MLTVTKEEKDLIHTMLYALLNHRNTNEWEQSFLQSIIDKDQTKFSHKQTSKIKSIMSKCNDYEFPTFLQYILTHNTYENKPKHNQSDTKSILTRSQQTSVNIDDSLPSGMVNRQQ